MDDIKLVKGLKKKKESALVALIEKYSPYVSTVVRNAAGNAVSASDTEEITADVFIKLWNCSEQLRADTLRSFLAAVARNLIIDRLRKLKCPLPIDEIELSDNADIEKDAERLLLREEINSALDEIKPRHKELLLRFYFYCQQIAHIAAEMNMTESACKTALHRARLELKEKLERKGYGNEI